MSNVYVPQDLLGDILSRLPVKSLLRFKCVSRSWYLMIDSPDFIRMHAERSEKTESSKKLIAGGLRHGDHKLYAVDFNFLPENSKAKDMDEVNYPSMMHDRNNGITFAGSCNGLVCLIYSKKLCTTTTTTTTVLWNPSTRKHLQLPICSKQYSTLTVYTDCVHGFGYDEVSDDYKVVRLVRYCDEHFLHTSYDFLIYSLKSNEWRSLEDFSYGYDLEWGIDGVFTNGALHWLLEDHSILAFNLGTEGSFQVLPPPEASSMFSTCDIRVLGGCLHLIFGNFFRGACEMWVMKNYGIKEYSWTKLTVDRLINRSAIWPFAIFKSDKHINLEAGSCETIVIYALEDQRFQKVQFPEKMDKVKACVYFESLVRIDAGGRSDGTAGTSGKQQEGRKKKKLKGLHLMKKIASTIRKQLKLGTNVN